MSDAERIDKVLWAIRLFKTRTEATDACKGGKVKTGGVNAKPSREVKVGETIEIRKGAVRYSYRIKQLPECRMGAGKVSEYAENLTPESELDKLKTPVETFVIHRDRGLGRPTKKDRRAMEEAWDNIEYNNATEDTPDDIEEESGLSENESL